MKIILRIFVGIVIIMVLSMNLMTSKVSSDNANINLRNITALAEDFSEGGGNQAACYSTYHTPLIGGEWIWVCGSCVQVKANTHSDPGICYF